MQRTPDDIAEIEAAERAGLRPFAACYQCGERRLLIREAGSSRLEKAEWYCDRCVGSFARSAHETRDYRVIRGTKSLA